MCVWDQGEYACMRVRGCVCAERVCMYICEFVGGWVFWTKVCIYVCESVGVGVVIGRVCMSVSLWVCVCMGQDVYICL